MSRPPVPDGPYLVVGLSRAGVAATQALIGREGPDAVAAVDSGHPVGTRAAVAELVVAGVPVELGSDGLDRLDGAACVIKSPGVPMDAPVIAAAHARGLPVLDELELGWRLGAPPLVAVTGTNGKSTTCRLLSALLEAPAVGNVEWGPPLSVAPREVPRLVCEVSSYQLEGCPDLLPEVAVFTNLTPDHLERHPDMTDYGEAKRRLFVRGERAVPLAVVFADDPAGAQIAADVEARGGRAVRVGRAPGADVVVREARWTTEDAHLVVDTPSGPLELATRLPGPHNAINAALALATARELGVPDERTVAVLARTAGVPGRFERIDAGQDFDVIVDFAHTPDALQQALTTTRVLADERGSRLHVVLCDAGHRPAMLREPLGAIAGAIADRVVVTEGSSGAVATEVITPPLLRGARGAGHAEVEFVPKRRDAFRAAFAGAAAGDLVVMVGRGARPVLRDGPDGRGQPFDDRVVAREILLEARA